MIDHSRDPSWNVLDPASKARAIEVLRREVDGFVELASDPSHWSRPTACAGWEVRDMVGHLVDAMESYLTGFGLARSGGTVQAPVGMHEMARVTDEAARKFRDVAQEDLLERFRRDTDRLIEEFDGLSNDDWSRLLVPDRYLGPLPAMVVVAGMVAGLTVHGWDVRAGLGLQQGIPGDAADLLVPFLPLVWSATAVTSAVDEAYSIGLRVSGRNGGDTRIDVSKDGLRFTPADVSRCAAVLDLDPGTLLLTVYGRVDAGSVQGDSRAVAMFRSLFISI